ncbi:thiamine diphosphokinase [Fictibacillus fluitans]|uniref:Thiamine diphosphokinase n=1 Tax=Fictibacillus fluitans TaxID=3058422 RepID=A0ABT8HRS9_9BACL|nr:thiamine diphosphokinase [Fictibacillus sp. NE201]MDN4523465.1 thiamine diphosphokinase [Fictibacillus sp. NE201]
MKIIIVAGGPEEKHPDFSCFPVKDSIWVGVDRGVYHLLKKGIKPHYAFGDFDSLNSSEKEWMSSYELPLFEYDSEKDKTDLELALEWAVAEQPERILLVGATGGRLDHELANIQLLLMGLEHRVPIEILDCQNSISLRAPGTYEAVNEREYPYLSFLPFNGPVAGFSLYGFKYPLKNQHLAMGSTLCISNELVNKSGTYSFSDGILMFIKSHD